MFCYCGWTITHYDKTAQINNNFLPQFKSLTWPYSDIIKDIKIIFSQKALYIMQNDFM